MNYRRPRPQPRQEPEAPGLAILELYPEISEDIDRRIAQSVTQIKYWVVAGVLATAVTTIGIGIPAVYNLGRLTSQIEVMQARVDQLDIQPKGR